LVAPSVTYRGAVTCLELGGGRDRLAAKVMRLTLSGHRKVIARSQLNRCHGVGCRGLRGWTGEVRRHILIS
jgi:hypothetical protein